MSERMKAYKVPEGYFDSLKTRLEEIPVQERNSVREVPLWQKLQPYLALAACFALALIAGSLFLVRTESHLDEDFQDYYYSHINSIENPYGYYDTEYFENTDTYVTSEDDIIEYLIASGAKADYVAYLINQ